MKIYAAGNIAMHDWRNALIAPASLDRSPSINWPIQSTTIPDVLYTGPYQHICGDECTGHVADHARLEKVQRLTALWNADIVFAWLPDISPLVLLYTELGVAHGYRRTIWGATNRDVKATGWLLYLAERSQLGATDPIAALTHMINNPEKRGFTWPAPVSSLDQDLLGSKA